MALIPTKEALGGIPLPVGQPAGAPARDFISPAIESAGEALGQAATIIGTQQRMAARQQYVSQSAAANAQLAEAKVNIKNSFQQDPDYETFDQRSTLALKQAGLQAASMISDPGARQTYLNQIKPVIQSTRSEILGIANTRRMGVQQVGLDDSLDKQSQIYADPATDDATKDTARTSITNDIDRGLRTGLYTAAEAEARKQKYILGSVKTRAMIQAETDPASVASPTYYGTLIGHESGGDVDVKNPNSSATGLGQFTAGTWAGLMKSHPDLGLTPDGRTDPDQSKRALVAFTNDNATLLARNNIPVNDKNLYMAHFLGGGGAVTFMTAMQQNPSAPAASIFGDAAAANKTVFYNPDGSARSLAEVYNLQTRRFRSSDTATGATPGDPFAGLPAYMRELPPDDQLAVMQHGETVLRQQQSTDRLADAQRKADAQGFIDSDLASISKTGRALDGGPDMDQVAATLGAGKAIDYAQKRETAQRTYAATAPLSAMSDDDMADHVTSLQPKPGSQNFAQDEAIYEAAQQREQQLVKLRRNDPAMAVEDHPSVQAAAAAVRQNDTPETQQALAGARLAAQKAIGIPDVEQRAIPEQAAKDLAAPLIAASRITGKGNISKVEKTAVENVVAQVQHIYGPYADQVLPQVIEKGVKDDQMTRLATVIMKKIASGQTLTPEDHQNVEIAAGAASAAQAVQGTSSTVSSAPPPSSEAPPSTAWNDPNTEINPLVGTPGFGKPPPPKWPTPPNGAMEALSKHPDKADQFDLKYGPGSAKAILDPMKALADKPAEPAPVASDQAEVDKLRAKLPQAKQNAIRAAADALKSGANPREIESRLTAAGIEQRLWPVEWEYAN